MKKLLNKTIIVLIGLLSIAGISVNTNKVFASINHNSYANFSNISETTPLFLFHGTDLVTNGKDGSLGWHYSHQSHGSHSSHGSHTSHYSSLW